MKFIKEITSAAGKIDIRFAKGIYVNEYELQLINRESHFMKLRRDKRSKSHFYADSGQFCSIASYLPQVILSEIAFLQFLIDLLEKINQLQMSTYLYLTADTILLRETREFCLLALPVHKETYEPADQQIKELLVEILKKVRVSDGCHLLGLLILHLKKEDFRFLPLLQELHNCMPQEAKQSLLQRIFQNKQSIAQESYPPPPVCHEEIRERYVEEICEPQEKTALLFQDDRESGYLQSADGKIAITSDEFHIGRQPDCDYYLNIPSISKQHAVIVREADGFYIKDLKSMNATFINGQQLLPMQPKRLKDKDAICLGNVALEFHET